MERAVLDPTHPMLFHSWIPSLLLFFLLDCHPDIQSTFLQLQGTNKTLRLSLKFSVTGSPDNSSQL